MTRTKKRSVSKSRRTRQSKEKRSKRTSRSKRSLSKRSKRYLKKKDKRSKTRKGNTRLPYVMEDYQPISRHQPYSLSY